METVLQQQLFTLMNNFNVMKQFFTKVEQEYSSLWKLSFYTYSAQD